MFGVLRVKEGEKILLGNECLSIEGKNTSSDRSLCCWASSSVPLEHVVERMEALNTYRLSLLGWKVRSYRPETMLVKEISQDLGSLYSYVVT